MELRFILVSVLTGVILASCASLPAPDVRRGGTANHAGQCADLRAGPVEPDPGPQAVIRRGTGHQQPTS